MRRFPSSLRKKLSYKSFNFSYIVFFMRKRRFFLYLKEEVFFCFIDSFSISC